MGVRVDARQPHGPLWPCFLTLAARVYEPMGLRGGLAQQACVTGLLGQLAQQACVAGLHRAPQAPVPDGLQPLGWESLPPPPWGALVLQMSGSCACAADERLLRLRCK